MPYITTDAERLAAIVEKIKSKLPYIVNPRIEISSCDGEKYFKGEIENSIDGKRKYIASMIPLVETDEDIINRLERGTRKYYAISK